MVIDYSLLWKFSVLASMVFAALGILAYALILEFRMQILLRWKVDFHWKRIWIPLALFALSLVYGAVVSFIDGMHWKVLACGALVLGCILGLTMEKLKMIFVTRILLNGFMNLHFSDGRPIKLNIEAFGNSINHENKA